MHGQEGSNCVNNTALSFFDGSDCSFQGTLCMARLGFQFFFKERSEHYSLSALSENTIFGENMT